MFISLDSGKETTDVRMGHFFCDALGRVGDRDVPPILSSTSVWSPIPYPKEIGREEAFYRRA
ncbi:hypothetical protein, partial [Xanthomonas arboricola]|uniref:hypothetical protein n=1 Tax=Xanthomonas arboricola TaxID=56448 RepID=UPI001CA4AFCB